ncbi:hypothetical protein A2V61_01245 [Candidatus Woesebacteria bacterium RBG_19FT_COMBO_47_8]|uniref:Uncharacterized protein n=1 Tax=Candidatus Woesebacteria bacterium RBG_13_46_13 TaxID=1802479 RepID=A0A1F7X3S1_9BACT|nr:MAG: hypothetical protein A2Y68_03925 [Candidatus Woesebacteria bacterium RBG_13_46_13]OGM18178.1 MAG: hypothetical protein A2V61_01245 [Candidatus Woesebacteria bacterium RBG_19FT_COMBO_47_8]HJX58948.1 hypothetical protein [Patescibacteria group bacterium]
MKKYWPLILFVIGILVLAAVFYFIARSTKETSSPEDESESVPEVALSERPIASLIPSTDGHWLKMKIEKIKISAVSLDYELLYTLPDGRTQGVPGSINLKTQEGVIERDLLLGSESSGKFRYDEGVEEGTLTLKFRNDAGKLVAKFSTKFHLQQSTKALSSVAGEIKIDLAKIPTKTFFVTMETFGIPGDTPQGFSKGPWGVFSSAKTKLAGTVELGSSTLYRWDGAKWAKLSSGASPDLGIFVGASE